MTEPRGKLIIVSGPSGVGKDTILDRWRARNPRVQRVVAYTTRSPRPAEVDGVDYHFTARARFDELARAGAFLEFKEVHGNMYATPLADMDAMLAKGLFAVLKIDVQGAMSAMALRPDALTVFIMPPSVEDLEARIRSRRTDSEAAIELRLADARNELALADRYRYRIVNDEVERAVDELEAVVAADA